MTHAQVHRRSGHRAVTLILIAAALLILLPLLTGCSSVAPPDMSYVATHRKLYEAKKPYMQGYAAEHPSLAPGINGNLQAEDALIRSAEARQ